MRRKAIVPLMVSSGSLQLPASSAGSGGGSTVTYMANERIAYSTAASRHSRRRTMNLHDFGQGVLGYSYRYLCIMALTAVMTIVSSTV